MKVVAIAVNVEDTTQHEFIVHDAPDMPTAQEAMLGYLAYLRGKYKGLEWRVTTIPHVLYGFTDPQADEEIAKTAPISHLRFVESPPKGA